MHCGERVAEWQGEKIAIYHTELQFNLIQLSFIVIPLNSSHSASFKCMAKQERNTGSSAPKQEKVEWKRNSETRSQMWCESNWPGRICNKEMPNM